MNSVVIEASKNSVIIEAVDIETIIHFLTSSIGDGGT